MRRFANVSCTIGRFSTRRSSECAGRNPTYVSVFAWMSTYEGVPQRAASMQGQDKHKPSRHNHTKITCNTSWFHSKQQLATLGVLGLLFRVGRVK